LRESQDDVNPVRPGSHLSGACRSRIHSSRGATIGSTLVARRAGISVAGPPGKGLSVSSVRRVHSTHSVKERLHECVSPHPDARPKMMPVVVSRRPCLATIARTCTGVAASAIWMPISCARRVTRRENTQYKPTTASTRSSSPWQKCVLFRLRADGAARRRQIIRFAAQSMLAAVPPTILPPSTTKRLSAGIRGSA
jgi:hypothetical protein